MTEVIMKVKNKKGKVHYKKDKMKNPQLVSQDGCNGCKNICSFNRQITHPNVADGNIYPCHSSLKTGVNNV